MGLAQTLFGFRGRIPRRTWWIWTLVLSAVMMGALAAVFIHVGKDNFENIVAFDLSSRSLQAFLALSAFVTWIGIALGAKRLHDRNIRGFWVVFPALITTAIIAMRNTGHGGTFEEPSVAVHLLTLASMGFNLWLLVVCGFLKGTLGPNRFGADPLGATKADQSLGAPGVSG
jgi:uncharacterized membrane protein YhaH (DUF805 family)